MYMNEGEPLKIANDFKKYLDTGDKSLIAKHTKRNVKSALSAISPLKKDRQWYKEMERFVEEKEKKWWNEPLFVGIVSSIVGAMVGAFITYFILK